jgi:hypothetical protein
MTLPSSRYLRVHRNATYWDKVRTTRAYLAGLGTAGAIIVGAALVFVLASAVVAFRGWPNADGVDSPARVVVSAPARSDTPAARRLASLVAGSRPGGIRSTASAPVTAVEHPHRSAAVPGVGGSGLPVSIVGGPPRTRPTQPPTTTSPIQPPTTTPGRTTTTPAPPTTTPAPPTTTPAPPTTTPAPPTTTPAPPTTTPAPPTTTPAPPTTTPAPPTTGGGTSTPVVTVVKKVTGTLGDTVSGTGAGVGTILKQVTAPVSGPVSTVGSGAGDTITKVTGLVGGVLSGG